MNDSIKTLKEERENLALYNAGFPKFTRNFTRDSIISAMILRDAEMLKNQLRFCALKQGKEKKFFSGEEPGKIFHEYPGVNSKQYEGLSTEYNACDTTALFIIGHKLYKDLTNKTDLFEEQKENIEKAIDYILNHLKNNKFIEDPKFSNAKRFALKVTYWKDSVIINRENGKPAYPAVFTLAHIQNMYAIKCASQLLNSEKLKEVYEKMKEALNDLWDSKLGLFYIAIDEKGPISGISSDSLHSLYYLDEEDLSKEKIKSIEEASKVLETKIGYSSLDPKLAKNMENGYHSKTVWPFEQAIIHLGSKKFNLKKAMEVSSRILNYLDTNPEIFILKEGEFKKGGCDPQLWTIAAKDYFKKNLSFDVFKNF